MSRMPSLNLLSATPSRISHVAAAVLLVLGFAARITDAVLASPFPFNVKQPDGSTVTLYVKGNEFVNYLADPNGYPVVRSSASSNPSGGIQSSMEAGSFVYATVDGSGSLQPTPFAVGAYNPSVIPGLSPMVAPSVNETLLNAIEEGFGSHAYTSGTGATGTTTPPNTGDAAVGLGMSRRRRFARRQRNRRAVTTGNVKNLVLMIRWRDSPYLPRTPTTPGLPTVQDLNPLFNGQTDSIRDIYLKNSYGKLTIESVFTDWITVSQTEAEAAGTNSGRTYGGPLQTAIHEALRETERRGFALKSFDLDNDNNIDMITILHSGYGAEWQGPAGASRIWSHQWNMQTAYVAQDGVQVKDYHISPALWSTSGTNPGRVGVIAHETAHFLGLPDLYDTDGPGYGQGLGSWSLLANSWGWDGSQNFPPLMDAWSKVQLGWATPTVINTAGTYQIRDAANYPDVYKITKGFPDGEYLLIENRQPVGWDFQMPRGGLAIYHVDEKTPNLYTQGWPAQAGWPQNGNHYRVALLQADGLFQLESTTQQGDAGDLWSTSTRTVLSSSTVPNTNAYQAGVIMHTGVRITIETAPAFVMRFTVAFDPIPTANGAPASTCADKIMNGGESGVDCGGPLCPPCPTTCQAAGVACNVAPRTLLKTSTMCMPHQNCDAATCCADVCTVLTNGAPCNDNNARTTNDKCVAKVCRGSLPCTLSGLPCPTGQRLSATKTCIPMVNCNALQCCSL